MGTITTLTVDVRSRFAEPTAKFILDSEIMTWFNFAIQDIVTKTECIEDIRSFATVLNQMEYTLPANFIKTSGLFYWNGGLSYRLIPKDLRSWGYLISGNPASDSDPTHYNLWSNKFRLYPIPPANAETTTLNGGISAVDTTITVVSTTDFNIWGRVKIGSEIISYTSTTATTLTGCTRGEEGTTAAIHLTGATVTHNDLLLYYFRKGTAVTAGGDTPEIPDQYHELLVLYAVSIALRKDNKHADADKWLAQYERGLDLMKSELWLRRRDQSASIKDEDLIEQDYLGS